MTNKLLKQVRLMLPSPKSLIAFVGAGGKTTCLYQLASMLIKEGATVLVTTTTRLFHPEFEHRENWQLKLGPFYHTDTFLQNKDGKVDIAAAAIDPKVHKLVGYTPREINKIVNWGRYDYILVEADGAKQKPIKAPAEHEPVIPDTSALVLGFIGLNCIGFPLHDLTVHRAELFAKLVDQALGSVIDENSIKKLILSKMGIFKNAPKECRKVVVLNKADTPALQKKGLGIQKAVMQNDKLSIAVEQVLVGALK